MGSRFGGGGDRGTMSLHLPCEDGNGYLQQNREDHHTEGPNSRRDFPFDHAGRVFREFMQGRRDKTRDDQA